MTAEIVKWPVEAKDEVDTLIKVELACRLLREASNEATEFQHHTAAAVFFDGYCKAAFEAEKWAQQIRKDRGLK